MKIIKTFLLVLFIYTNVINIISEEYSMATPDDSIKYLIHLFKSYNKKEKDAALTEEQKSENIRIAKEINNVFDYPTLIKEILKDQWNKMNTSQQKEYFNIFKNLIELIAYPQGSYFYNNSETKFEKAKVADSIAKVNSQNYNYDKDLEINITYVFKKETNGWVLIDVEMNEHSLTEAYKLQINRIVNKDGLTGLMRVFREKHNELTKDL